MVLDPQPRRRTAWRFIIPLLLTVGVVVAFVVSAASQETRVDLDYVESMHDEMSRIALGAESLRDVSSRLFGVDRVEFVTVTDNLRADIATAQMRVASESTSDPLVGVHHLYRQALDAWAAGTSGYASAILLAADNPADEFAEDEVAEALAQLSAGDELYSALLVELEGEEVPQPVAPMPEVVLMPEEGSYIALSRRYVAAARSASNGLALLPGLAVAQLVSEPEMLVGPDGQASVSTTETVVFTVVVSNSGNVVSEPETLHLTMTGGEAPIDLSVEVPVLEPGRQTTMVFDAVPVEPGLVYEASAALLVTNPDSSLDDNEQSVVFLVNEA